MKCMSAIKTLTISFLSLMTVSLSFSEDGKTYSGNGCTMDSPSTIEYFYGKALNKSNSMRIIRCPVIRDSGAGIARARVKVIDKHPDQDLVCILFSYNEFSTGSAYNVSRLQRSVDVSTGQCPESWNANYCPFASGVRPMEFPHGLDLPLEGSYPDPDLVSYFLECWVPGVYNGEPSGIVSYWILEK